MNNNRSNMGKVNESFFSQYNEDMAYVLGFLFSDGYLANPKNKRKFVGLKLIDLQILEDIKERMGLSNKIYHTGLTSSGNKLYRIEIPNPNIVSDLEKLGMHERKTFTIKFPKDLPETYSKDFIRGYFDGDGCIHIANRKNRVNSCVKSFTILGTRDVLDGISKRLPCESHINKYGKIFRLTVYKEDDLQKVYEFLYEGQDILSLKRKKEHFELALKQVKDSKQLQSQHIKTFFPRFSNEQFIEMAKEVHGERYNYSLAKYVDYITPMVIICSKHGEFEQTPEKHLRGHGCQKCSGSFMNKEYFIEKSREIHGEKYDYQNVEYVDNKTKVKIICPSHGEFCQTPSNHLLKRGCRQCGIESRKNKMMCKKIVQESS